MKTNIGRILILYTGEYSPLRAYARLDAVTRDGSSYLCLKPCAGVPVSNEEYWTCIARRGNDGEVRWSNMTEEEKNDILNQINLSTIGFTNVGGFYVCDEAGNVVLKYDADGFDIARLSPRLVQMLVETDGIGQKLGELPGTGYPGEKGAENARLIASLDEELARQATLLGSKIDALANVLDAMEVSEDGFYITDADGNILMQATSGGFGAAAITDKFKEVLEDAGISDEVKYEVVSEVDY